MIRRLERKALITNSLYHSKKEVELLLKKSYSGYY